MEVRVFLSTSYTVEIGCIDSKISKFSRIICATLLSLDTRNTEYTVRSFCVLHLHGRDI